MVDYKTLKIGDRVKYQEKYFESRIYGTITDIHPVTIMKGDNGCCYYIDSDNENKFTRLMDGGEICYIMYNDFLHKILFKEHHIEEKDQWILENFVSIVESSIGQTEIDWNEIYESLIRNRPELYIDGENLY